MAPIAAILSGTENIDKTYAESIRRVDHLQRIQDEEQVIVVDPMTAKP